MTGHQEVISSGVNTTCRQVIHIILVRTVYRIVVLSGIGTYTIHLGVPRTGSFSDGCVWCDGCFSWQGSNSGTRDAGSETDVESS